MSAVQLTLTLQLVFSTVTVVLSVADQELRETLQLILYLALDLVSSTYLWGGEVVRLYNYRLARLDTVRVPMMHCC